MTHFLKSRLSLIYFAMFAFIGIHMPFWPVWLKSKGMSPTAIALLTALSFALKIVFTPLVSKAVDRSGRRRQAIVLLACGLFAGFLVFFVVDGFWAILFLTTLTFACWSPIMSLAESLTTVTAKERGFDYGKIRLWGSVGFMVVAVSSGRLLAHYGEAVLLWSICTAAGLLFVASLLLPKVESGARKSSNAGVGVFFRSRWFVIFLLATTLVQGSHAAYYTFASIHWRAQGLSDGSIGLLWGASVAVELLFFAFGKGLLARLGPVRVIALGGVAAALRWVAIGMTANVGLLLAAQCLHALSFGAGHFAAMRIITEKVDAALSSTAQGIYSAFSMGIGMGVFVMLSGPLYGAVQGSVFIAMGIVALLGTICMVLLPAHLEKIVDAAPAPADTPAVKGAA